MKQEIPLYKFLSEKAKKLGIIQFSNKEEQEFYTFLKSSPDINFYSFENNWPYILQSTRNGQYKFYFKNTIVYFTLRFKQKLANNFIVIVNFLGKERREAVLYLSKIFKENNIKVLIKNVDKTDIFFWKKHDFIESVEPWGKYSFRDDNTFPLHIISRETISNRKFNKDYRRLFKKFDKENIITEDYNFSFDNVTKSLLNKNATFLFNKGVDKKEEVIRAHLFFFDRFILKKIRVQHIKNCELIGVSYLTKVNDVVFYNALFCNKEEDLMKYLLYQGMNYVVHKFPEVKFFSIQGSENNGQDFFKRRYYPSFSIDKTHLVYK